MVRTINRSGQALVEWALLLPLYGFLILAIVAFGKWFCIQHQLILAAREGALLYSSGRFPAAAVKNRLRHRLALGSPAVSLRTENIVVQKKTGFHGWAYELDEVIIRFPIPRFWRRTFKFKDMEELCVIKHAPVYGASLLRGGIPYGRPVDW
jgi:hypothetical protein